MHGPFSDNFVMFLVEVRTSPKWQDKIDNTSDKNVDVWQHIAKELWRAIQGGFFGGRGTFSVRWNAEGDTPPVGMTRMWITSRSTWICTALVA